jgi:hypothetical protein
MKAGDPNNRNADWFGQFIRFAMMESAEKRVGGEGVLAKLSELMFIEVVRRYVERLPPEQSGWLAGLRDPFIGKALSLLHTSSAQNWTIEQLAKQVGLSRSLLADRFTTLVGIPPMQYLAQWRDCIGTADWWCQSSHRRGRNRLYIRRGFQPPLQKDSWDVPLRLASPPQLATNAPIKVPRSNANVRFWHKADILNALTNVRFWGQSGHRPTAAYQSRFMSTRPRLPSLLSA